MPSEKRGFCRGCLYLSGFEPMQSLYRYVFCLPCGKPFYMSFANEVVGRNYSCLNEAFEGFWELCGIFVIGEMKQHANKML